ncbi:hypothetical protein ABH937_006887 [Kitasatospora sp. GAS1066B]
MSCRARSRTQASRSAAAGHRVFVRREPAVLVRGQRKRGLKIPSTWPWADEIVTAFRRLQVLPRPT